MQLVVSLLIAYAQDYHLFVYNNNDNYHFVFQILFNE